MMLAVGNESSELEVFTPRRSPSPHRRLCATVESILIMHSNDESAIEI